MALHDDDLARNRRWWDERAGLHADTPMYRPWLERLRRGEPALFELERRLMGDVAGMRVLHLPCHIGHDTLSWALLGAHVTGVDFSPVALAEARRLQEQVPLPAEVEVQWVQADAQNLPEAFTGRFDRVVATYGAYGWMPDLGAWLRGVARSLAPGGRFVLVDGHPIFLGLEHADGHYRVAEPMMGGGRVQNERSGSYADPNLPTQHDVEVGWCHGVGALVQGVLDAGLVVEGLEEHPFCVWEGVPGMVRDGELFRLPAPWDGHIPLMLSMVARKP